MIIQSNGKLIAFGMRWESLLDAGSPQKFARSRNAQMMWFDKTMSNTNIGLLIEKEKPKTGKKSGIHAGAMEVARQFPTHQNILFICHIPSTGPIESSSDENVPRAKTWLVCGIYRRWPHRQFDHANITLKEASELFTKFAAMCSGENFLLLGNAVYDGITPYDLPSLLEKTSHETVLKSVSGLPFDPKKAAVGAVVLGSLGFGAKSYLDYQHNMKMLEANRAEHSSQDIYADTIMRKRKTSSLPAANINQFTNWLRTQPTNVGGWKLKKISCTVQDSNKAVCSSDYQRGPLMQATYDSFLKFSPVLKQNVNFDIDGVQIHTAVTLLKEMSFSRLGVAMDAANDQRSLIIDFGSKLQQLTGFGETKLKDFTVYALPPGIATGQISKPVRAANWTVKGPFRVAEALSNFPANAIVQNITVTIGNLANDYQLGSSFAQVEITGLIFST